MLYDPASARYRQPGAFTSDMFGILGCLQNRHGILAGFLSQQQQFNRVECIFDPLSLRSHKFAKHAALAPVLRMRAAGDDVILSPGDVMVSDWACLQFVEIDRERPIDPYLNAVAAEHRLDARGRRNDLPAEVSPPQNGWCSWYFFYQNITETNLRANLKTASALHTTLPLDLFQIDDGFETRVGDWFDFRPGFPNGVAPLAAEIRKSGFMPGLWLAPFILQPSSVTAKEHPEWLLRNQGRPVNAGFVWDSLTYALDLTHPDALGYATGVVHRAVHEWGYEFIKLDFLYAGALAGQRYRSSKTRAQILRHALQGLRDAAGANTILLGCGCPLGPAIGLMDVMRIGPDVDQRWKPSFAPLYKVSPTLNDLIFDPETNMPSARNAINNILTRLQLHQRWWINDPDCLVLRETSNLSFAEVQTLATAIFMSAGQFLLSDDLPSLNSQRLRIAQSMLPLLPEAASAEDWLESSPPCRLSLSLDGPAGKWRLLAFFNWADEPVRRTLHAERYQITTMNGQIGFLCDFWNGEIMRLSDSLEFSIPPHGVRLFALRFIDADQPAYLGSNLHMSQGLEVMNWQYNPKHEATAQITLRTSTTLVGKAFFYLPGFPDQARWRISAMKNNAEYQPLPVENLFQQIAQIEIACSFQPIDLLIQETPSTISPIPDVKKK
jgi:alpha-galactosidase